MAKRLICIIISVLMVASLLPTSAFATSSSGSTNPEIVEISTVTEVEVLDEELTAECVVEEKAYDENYGIALASDDVEETSSTNSELPSADSDGVIKLEADYELTSQCVIGTSVTIDLNGHTITRASTNTTAGLIKVSSDATLTVKDTSSTGNGSIDGATYTVDGTTYVGYGIWVEGGTVNVSSGIVTGYRGIYGTAGTLNVTGGTVSGTQIGIMANNSLTVNVSDTAVVTGAHSAIYGYQGSYTGTVTVSGGTVGGNSTQYAINMIAGNLVVSGSAVVTAGKSVSSGWVYAIYLGAGATAKISDSASVTATNSTGYSAGIVYFGNSVEETPTTLEISGGTISGTTYGLSGNGSSSYSKVTISGGTITSDFIAIYHPEMGDIEISGGTITGVYAGIQLIAGTLKITGGTITATATAEEVAGNANSVENKTGDGAIADGAAVSIINRSGYGATQSDGTATTSYESVTISGGTITSASGVDAVNAYTYSSNAATPTTENVSVTGGTYSSDVSAYVDTTSSTAIVSDDGSTTVIEVGSNVAALCNANGNYVASYTTLKAAINAASDGYKVVLIADVDSTTLYSASSKSITLDLAGHSLSVTSGYALQISQYASGTLTIMDSVGAGTIKSTAKTALYVGASSLNIVVNGGNFESAAYDIYNGGTGTVTITDGTFTSVSYAVKNASTGAIVISGGYYSDYHTLSSYLADGYAVGDQITDTDSDYYEMYPVVAAAFVVSYSDTDNNKVTESYATLYQAWSALSNIAEGSSGIEVKMNSDSDQYFKVESGISATLDLNGYSLTYSGNAAQVYGTLTIRDSSDTQEGTITSSSESNGVAAIHVYEGGSVTIKDVSVSGRIAVLTESTGAASITSGNINGTLSGSVTVTGGYFTDDPSSYLKTGYCTVDSSNETYIYTVVAVELGASSNESAVAATSITGYGTGILYVGVSNTDNTYTTTNYPTTTLTYTDDDGETHSYIFAGWYEDSAGTTACTSVPSGTAYAKFVDADVLNVACVYTPYSSGDYDAWRFFSSVVSANYDAFFFVVDGTEQSVYTYYTDYTVSSVNHKFVPSEISSSSEYLFTYGMHDTNKASSHTVQAGYVTLDGTKVYGTSITFSNSSVSTATIFGLENVEE